MTVMRSIEAADANLGVILCSKLGPLGEPIIIGRNAEHHLFGHLVLHFCRQPARLSCASAPVLRVIDKATRHGHLFVAAVSLLSLNTVRGR